MANQISNLNLDKNLDEPVVKKFTGMPQIANMNNSMQFSGFAGDSQNDGHNRGNLYDIMDNQIGNNLRKSEMQIEEMVPPNLKHLQKSYSSADDTMYDLRHNEMSISIDEAKKVTE